MSNRLFDEELSRLTLALRDLAQAIAASSDPDKSLEDVKRKYDLGEKYSEVLNNCLRILLEFHINPNVQQKEYLAKLTALGIPENSAKSVLTLVREEPSPPTSAVKDEIQFEISRRNYVRAVMLAEKTPDFPQEEIWHLKELALRQYAFDYQNMPGFNVLVEDWKVPRTEVERILSGQ